MATSTMRKVGAAWRKKSQKGTTFYSGRLDTKELDRALSAGETDFLIFPVKEKRSQKSPDIEIFCVPPYQPQAQRPAAPVQATREPGDELDDFGGELP